MAWKRIPYGMRNRAVLLFILSGLLALAPWLQWHKQQAECLQNQPASVVSPFANVDDSQTVCPQTIPLSPWLRASGIASAACFIGFLFYIAQGVMERRRDQALLRSAGIYVEDRD